MSDLTKIAELMRADWNRRVAHDYLFWMSDGWQSQEAMWQSGARDFEILCAGLEHTAGQRVLEIGCGVGRLLKPALSVFRQVIGLDVSSIAITKAKELLPAGDALDLHVSSGIDLKPVPDGAVDVVLSFATLACVPAVVFANYLREMHRVLKPGGKVRLQIYLGSVQSVTESDTLSLRCYACAAFEAAAAQAGFKVESISDLVLPVEVSIEELGIKAVIVALHKTAQPPAALPAILATLLPGGEAAVGEAVADGELEYWMAVNHAKDLAAQGELEQALRTLEYGVRFSHTVTTDVRDLMGRLVKQLGPKPGAESSAPTGGEPPVMSVLSGNPAVFEKNMTVLRERFPEAAAAVAAAPRAGVEVKDSQDGAVIWYSGLCLDHAQKPIKAGAAWTERLLREERLESAQHLVVFGFGGGYHVEALLAQSGRAVSAIEPIAAVMRAALETRDLSACLAKLKHLSVDAVEDLKFFDEESELAVRPQHQSIAGDYCRTVRSKCYGTRGLVSIRPQIGVLGPMQGGTLPIMGYTTRALALLNQRVRMLDVSAFAPGFFAAEKFLNNDILRANAQGYYVEMLSKIVLDSVTEKPVDILICMAQAPLTAATLTELRQRGVITVLWFVEDYQRFRSWEVMAPYYDYIFTIQRGSCMEAIKAAGCREVHYLPTAFDPMVHMPLELSAEEWERWGSQISFVGAGYHNRQQMFAALANLPFKIWGTEWPECRPFDRLVQEKGRRLMPEEYIKIFNASKINLNLHSSTERDGVEVGGDFVNPRTFELAGCGAFQLTDPRTLLPELFTYGRDLAVFEHVEELKDKIAYYNSHEDERRQIAAQGRERALARHTYQHRIKEMLSVIYSGRLEQLKRRENASPWRKILDRSKPFPELHKRCLAAFNRGEEPGLDGLVSDIVAGKGTLTETEQKLLFLFHVSKQIIRMKKEEMGDKGPQ